MSTTIVIVLLIHWSSILFQSMKIGKLNNDVCIFKSMQDEGATCGSQLSLGVRYSLPSILNENWENVI